MTYVMLLPHIPLQRPRPNLRSINHAIGIRRHALVSARARRILVRIRNERPNRSVSCAADADAALPPRSILRYRSGLGIRDVNVVAGVDINPARAAELIPRVEEFAVLVENLDSIVSTISDEQPAA